MKNVTIRLEDDVAQWARVWAAENNKSVSKLLGETLKEKMLSEGRYQRAQAQYFARPAKMLKESNARYPKREDLYGR